MKNWKKLLTVLAITSIVGFSGLKSYADGTGVVDIDKVISNYSKAQDVSADLKVKEAELQKFQADAQKQIKEAKTPLEKKNMEDKLTEEFKQKIQDYKDAQVKQLKQVEDSVFAAVDSVAKQQKLDLILNKSSVLRGGSDITDAILNILNSEKSK